MDQIDLENCLKRVCVMNIPGEVSEELFATIMASHFGSIQKSYLRVPNSKGFKAKPQIKTKYGFVTFNEKRSRDLALKKGFIIDPVGKKWQIREFKSKNESRNLKMKEIESQNVHVSTVQVNENLKSLS